MNNLLKCSKCKKTKSSKYFYKTKRNKIGFHYQCKECMKVYFKNRGEKRNKQQKEYMINRNGKEKKNERNIMLRIFVEKFLKDKYCMVCRTDKSLIFHHIDLKTKRFSIGKGRSGHSIKAIKNEINKCIILCVSCHARLHANLKWRKIS